MTTHRETGPEEIVNSLTHGLAAVIAVIGLGPLCRVEPGRLLPCLVFGAALVLMFASSCLYHAAVRPRLKYALWVVDHMCIYTMIAGTYTPYTVTLRAPGLLTMVWALALAGCVLKLFGPNRFPRFSLFSYLALGWLAVTMVPGLFHILPPASVYWLIAGGLAYTVGTVFFATHWFRYSHAVWHLFVMAGGFCHYVSIMIASHPA